VPFADTRKLIVAAPWPLSGPSIAIQVTAGCTPHSHSRSAETVTAPVPPAAPNAGRELAAVIWHLAELGAVTLTEDAEDVHDAAANAKAGAQNNQGKGRGPPPR